VATNSKKIIIVGAGYTGLSAAHDLVRAGHQVEIYEAEDDVGGLAGTFEVSPGRRLERFYHHWFTSDTAVLDLIKELGLGNRLKYINSNTGLYYANSIFRLASPFDLLKFSAIPFLDRIRTGLMALKARRIDDWKHLEDISAEEWIIKHGGKRAFEVIWKPLLSGKFGSEAGNVSAVWFWNKLKLRGSSRDEKGKESLVYFEGGFGAVTDALRSSLEKLGVKIYLKSALQAILSSANRVRGVRVQNQEKSADLVLCTTPLPTFLNLAPELPSAYKEQCAKIRYLGNVCIVLRLKQSLSKTYWLNVADPSFPFVGVIEHTNFDDRSNYGGEYIAFLSKYLGTHEAMFKMSDSEVIEYALPFVQKIFPAFKRDWLIGFNVWRAHYSQPVITKNYSKLIPSEKTPIENLWLSTMAQIYPEDRGTNYAVREGRKVAARMLSSI